MSFEHAKILWVAAILVPLLAFFLWATWRKRQALIAQFVQNKVLAQMSLGISASRQKIKRVLQLIAVAFLLLAVARPQWGFVWEEASQRGRDIVVAIDTSRSMLAEDIQPNRLARTKLAALDLLKLGKYDRFGLVAFAGTAFLQCPLTFDEEAYRQSVQILDPGILPQGGTAISAAIDAARDAFGKDADDNHKVIVLFTDGEDHEQGALETVKRAAEAGVRIFTVGAGTAAGEVLRVRDERGVQNFIKDASGNVVNSRLNEALLREIATTANGFYLPLNAANAMEVLYAKGLAPMPTSERTTKLMKRLKEQFYWPLGIAILLLILEVFVPEQKRVAKRKPEAPKLAAAAALLLFLSMIPTVSATPTSAQRMYERQEYERALSEYRELLAKNPNDPRLQHNAGAAAYQANQLEEALNRFQAAAASPDLDLQQQSHYNLGNTEFRLGENQSNLEERKTSWEQAVQNYEAALRINPADPDAVFNRDLVKKKLEELKKQQEEQQKKDPPNQDSEDKKDDDNKDSEKQKDPQDKSKENEENQPSDSDQQKQENQKQQPEQPSQDQQEQAQNQKDEQEKKADQSQAKNEDGQKEGDSKPEDQQEGQYAQMGKMTPAQAKQLLDAQRSEEKALLFIPQETKSPPRDRIFKDW